jgi:hypothetical protein
MGVFFYENYIFIIPLSKPKNDKKNGIKVLLVYEKNIYIMSSVHNWNDTLIFHKEAVSLAKKYNVELHAIANFKNKKINEIDVKGLPNYKNRIFRPLNWIKLLYRILKSKSSIVHFHDPELIIMGVFLKIFTNKKIIYDIHEDYTKTILNKSWVGPLWFREEIAKIFNFVEKKLLYYLI